MATQSNEPPVRLVCVGFTAYNEQGEMHRTTKAYRKGTRTQQSGRIYGSKALATRYSGCTDVRAVFTKEYSDGSGPVLS